jgi:hypothetical protein
MKMLILEDFKLGVVNGCNVVDVPSAPSGIKYVNPQDLIRGVIEQFSTLRKPIEDAASRGNGVPLSGVRIRPPLPKPTNIDVVGT